MRVLPMLSVLGLLSTPALAAPAQMTQDSGAPVGDNQNSKTAGQGGPVLLEDFHLIEKLGRFDRERIPERVVHARCTGVQGVFTATADFSRYTRASLFAQSGKITPVFVRFSTVMGYRSSPESARDPRGFAVKFYTDQGNWDLVGINEPIFFIRDAIKFPDFVHANKPSAVTDIQDPNLAFDFFSRTPESTYMLTWLYQDRGMPASYREMDGFGVHAFRLVNAQGQQIVAKFHWTSVQGLKNMTLEQQHAADVNYATADLYQRYSIGTNYQELPVNRPLVKVANNNQDGAMSFAPQHGETNYEPSNAHDVGSVVQQPAFNLSEYAVSGVTQQTAISKTDDFSQAGDDWRALSKQDQADLIKDLASDLNQLRGHGVKVREVSYFYKANQDYGTQLANATHLDVTEVAGLATKEASR